MEVIKVLGIVVKDMAYGESSKILTLLTRDYGVMSVIAKGAKSSKSRLLGVTGKMTYGYFYVIYKKNGLSILKSVDLVNSFTNVLMDIEHISYASYLLELTTLVMKEVNSSVFDLLINSLLKINDGLSPSVVCSIVELKTLYFLGVSPCIDGCSICGDQKNIQTISVDDGGYICSSCYKSGKIYDKKVIQLIRMFMLVDLEKLDKVSVQDSILKEINEFIEQYYDKYTGIYLKSRDFLKNLKRIG